MNANAAARQLDAAVERARSAAVRMGDDTGGVDVASWKETDLVAATPAVNVPEPVPRWDAYNVVERTLGEYKSKIWFPVGVYQVRESVLNARTGASELVTHDLPLAIERIGGAGSGQGAKIGHLSSNDLLAMGDDPAYAAQVLSRLGSQVPTPPADASSRLRMATFVDVIPLNGTYSADVYAGQGKLYIPRADVGFAREYIRAGQPLHDSILPQRSGRVQREPNSQTVERIIRANPLLANVFDRYGQSTDLWSASSVVLDTRAAARSIAGVPTS